MAKPLILLVTRPESIKDFSARTKEFQANLLKRYPGAKVEQPITYEQLSKRLGDWKSPNTIVLLSIGITLSTFELAMKDNNVPSNLKPIVVVE